MFILFFHWYRSFMNVLSELNSLVGRLRLGCIIWYSLSEHWIHFNGQRGGSRAEEGRNSLISSLWAILFHWESTWMNGINGQWFNLPPISNQVKLTNQRWPFCNLFYLIIRWILKLAYVIPIIYNLIGRVKLIAHSYRTYFQPLK